LSPNVQHCLPGRGGIRREGWQQATIIKRMTTDLNFSTLIVAPTVARTRRAGDEFAAKISHCGDLRRQGPSLCARFQMARVAVKKIEDVSCVKIEQP